MPDLEARSFDRETFRFLAELAEHNERPWFEANKQRYLDDCMEPALAFVRKMAPALASISPHFVASARRLGGSLMRIHRDTRFARDKSPYKLNIGIQFRHERGRDVHAPGFYVHIVPGSCFLGAGIWHPDPKALRAIRTEIVEQPELWQHARDDRAFRRHFELGGAQGERPPRGFPADGPHAADLRRKDFIAVSPLADADVVRASFADRAAARFAAARPLLQFLCGALDLPF
ncbi:MAG TPA: TIGR02453 family protein [Gammaproteobacteria bacterium]|nr:TIGR02453 family protein [Gammaproteobacteria bacterium]